MVAGWREGPDWGGGYPNSFRDVACAIGVARKIGPAYGASPDRVTLMGHSTGGWPAAVVGLTPTPFTPARGSCNATAGSLRPNFVVVEDGELNEVTKPDQADGLEYVRDFLGGARTTHPDAWAAADPFALAKRYRARANPVPFLLIHGSADITVAASGLRVVSESVSRRGLPESTCRTPRRRPHRRPVVQSRHQADPEVRDRKLSAEESRR